METDLIKAIILYVQLITLHIARVVLIM